MSIVLDYEKTISVNGNDVVLQDGIKFVNTNDDGGTRSVEVTSVKREGDSVVAELRVTVPDNDPQTSAISLDKLADGLSREIHTVQTPE